MKSSKGKSLRMGHATKLFVMGMAVAFPWIALNIFEHVFSPLTTPVMDLFYFVFGIYSITMLALMWSAAHDPFISLANLVRALRHGDYTCRTVEGPSRDPVGMLEEEINLLADALQQNRLAQTEDNFLLQNLIDKLEIAVLVLDDNHRLTMANPTFGRLFDKPLRELLGASVDQLCLTDALGGDSESTHWLDFPARSSRFMIHRTEFRQAGRARHLVLFTDLKNPLREEERTAWKRLIRVMGHELNNSLTPIISLTQSLKVRVAQSGLSAEKAASFNEALDVLGSRAQHLNHFMQDYSRLAKLPEPRRETVPLTALLHRVANLENNSRIQIDDGPECVLNVDPAQIENLLINLIKNAFDAMDKDAGSVRLGWKRQATEVTIWVDDEGPGLAGTENLFVPFFSTKQEGSGIGLILSREIAEANGGSLDLFNRPEGGCRALIVLPLTVSI